MAQQLDEYGGFHDADGIYHWQDYIWDDTWNCWYDPAMDIWRDAETLEPMADNPTPAPIPPENTEPKKKEKPKKNKKQQQENAKQTNIESNVPVKNILLPHEGPKERLPMKDNLRHDERNRVIKVRATIPKKRVQQTKKVHDPYHGKGMDVYVMPPPHPAMMAGPHMAAQSLSRATGANHFVPEMRYQNNYDHPKNQVFFHKDLLQPQYQNRQNFQDKEEPLAASHLTKPKHQGPRIFRSRKKPQVGNGFLPSKQPQRDLVFGYHARPHGTGGLEYMETAPKPDDDANKQVESSNPNNDSPNLVGFLSDLQTKIAHDGDDLNRGLDRTNPTVEGFESILSHQEMAVGDAISALNKFATNCKDQKQEEILWSISDLLKIMMHRNDSLARMAFQTDHNETDSRFGFHSKVDVEEVDLRAIADAANQVMSERHELDSLLANCRRVLHESSKCASQMYQTMQLALASIYEIDPFIELSDKANKNQSEKDFAKTDRVREAFQRILRDTVRGLYNEIHSYEPVVEKVKQVERDFCYACKMCWEEAPENQEKEGGASCLCRPLRSQLDRDNALLSKINEEDSRSLDIIRKRCLELRLTNAKLQGEKEECLRALDELQQENSVIGQMKSSKDLLEENEKLKAHVRQMNAEAVAMKDAFMAAAEPVAVHNARGPLYRAFIDPVKVEETVEKNILNMSHLITDEKLREDHLKFLKLREQVQLDRENAENKVVGKTLLDMRKISDRLENQIIELQARAVAGQAKVQAARDSAANRASLESTDSEEEEKKQEEINNLHISASNNNALHKVHQAVKLIKQSRKTNLEKCGGTDMNYIPYEHHMHRD